MRLAAECLFSPQLQRRLPSPRLAQNLIRENEIVKKSGAKNIKKTKKKKKEKRDHISSNRVACMRVLQHSACTQLPAQNTLARTMASAGAQPPELKVHESKRIQAVWRRRLFVH